MTLKDPAGRAVPLSADTAGIATQVLDVKDRTLDASRPGDKLGGPQYWPLQVATTTLPAPVVLSANVTQRLFVGLAFIQARILFLLSGNSLNIDVTSDSSNVNCWLTANSAELASAIEERGLLQGFGVSDVVPGARYQIVKTSRVVSTDEGVVTLTSNSFKVKRVDITVGTSRFLLPARPALLLTVFGTGSIGFEVAIDRSPDISGVIRLPANGFVIEVGLGAVNADGTLRWDGVYVGGADHSVARRGESGPRAARQNPRCFRLHKRRKFEPLAAALGRR